MGDSVGELVGKFEAGPEGFDSVIFRSAFLLQGLTHVIGNSPPLTVDGKVIPNIWGNRFRAITSDDGGFRSFGFPKREASDVFRVAWS